jgi:hypothetical protein
MKDIIVKNKSIKEKECCELEEEQEHKRTLERQSAYALNSQNVL